MEDDEMYTYPVSYPASGGDESRHVMPPTHRGWAIVATIVFLKIPGIVAIVYASKVSPQWRAGQWERARKSSNLAKMFVWTSIGLPVGLGILFLLLVFAMEIGQRV